MVTSQDSPEFEDGRGRGRPRQSGEQTVDITGVPRRRLYYGREYSMLIEWKEGEETDAGEQRGRRETEGPQEVETDDGEWRCERVV